MIKATKKEAILGSLLRLQSSLDANAAEIPHLDASRLKLGTMLGRAVEITKQQAALSASRQLASKELQGLLVEIQRLATVLRLAVKEHYGIRAEKLTEFHLQPFRGRARAVKPAPEEPEVTPPSPRPAPSDTSTTA
jgi:hypothetical protein